VDPRRSTILQATPYLLVEAGGRRFKSCPKSGRCGAPDRAASWDPRAYGPRAQDPTGLSGPCTSVEPMSDETAQRLEEVRATEAERRVEADDRKRECLTAVAGGIPVHLEEIAKRAAHGQPEVAKELGSDGITTFGGNWLTGR
jgi:hypothetical protein